MKRFSFIGLLFILITFTLSECKKNNNVQPNNPPADTSDTDGNTNVSYNKSDTSISLKHGQIVINIPAGAMEEGTKISIGSSDVTFIDTAHVLHKFELKPAGTKFKEPVTLTFHYNKAWLKGNSPWNIGIAYKDDKDGNWYAAVNGNVDTVKHTISIKTKHFSHWTIYNCFHLYMKADGQFSEDFSRTIVMQSRGDIGQLLMTMSEPPLWKQDPDKNKEFYHNPGGLVAPLIPAPFQPEEKDYKLIAPDAWFVNGIKKGNNRVGTIGPVPAPQTKNLFEYATPQKVPGDGDIAISAQINTINHGSIILIQGVQIVSKGYLPSPDITSESYIYNNGGKTTKEISSSVSGNMTTASIISHISFAGVNFTSMEIDTYDRIKTTIKSTPPVDKVRDYYNLGRSELEKLPGLTDVDTSFTVEPYVHTIPDGLMKGDKTSTSGSVTTYIDYNFTDPGDGSMNHMHSVLKTYYRNAVIAGYDSLKTNAGSFFCLILKYDYVVADTLIGIDPDDGGIDVEKETVSPTTLWLARDIGLVKSKSYDPSTGKITIATLKAIERKEN